MHLKKIKIQGFRSISNLEIDNIGQLNLLVGRNNSGKTSILEAIFTLMGAGNPELAIRIDNFRNLLHNQIEDFRFIFNELDYSKELKLTGHFDEDDVVRVLDIKSISSEQKVANNKIQAENDSSTSTLNSSSFSGKTNGLQFNLQIKKRYNNKETYQSKIYLDKEFTLEVDKKYKELISARYISPAISLGAGIENRLENIIVSKNEKSIVDALKQIDSSISGIHLGANGVVFFDTGLKRLIPANLFGDGIRRLLYLLSSFSDIEGGLFMIDEIDNGFHFSALKALWKSILTVAMSTNVQLFITTHSYETLKSLKECLEIDEFQQYQDKVKTYTIRKLPNSNVKAYEYPFESFETAIEEGIELR